MLTDTYYNGANNAFYNLIIEVFNEVVFRNEIYMGLNMV